MAGSHQKLPLGKSLNDLAARKALDFIHMTGKDLPSSIVKVAGSIVTVKFEVGGGYQLPNVIIPIVESLYSRGGHQVGDKGLVKAAAVTHGNMSGLGPSTAPGLAQPANLAALAFHPVGNSAWPDTGGKRFNQAKNGAVNQTLDGKNQVAALAGQVLLMAGGVSTALTPQNIAKLAQLIGSFVIGGGGGGASGGGAGGGSSTSTGIAQMEQLLLAYQYVQPISAATVLIASGVVVTNIDPASSLAALTVDFPASPTDGQVQFLSFTQGVTVLSLGGGTLASNAPTTVGSTGGAWTFQYQAAAAKWFVI